MYSICYTRVQTYFDQVRWNLTLEATEPVSQLVTQMTVEMIKSHLILVQQKR